MSTSNPSDTRSRCPWSEKHPLEQAYHDTEWGVPTYDDGRFFEFLLLESFQAGLSWLTILQKREGFRRAFDGFQPELIARYDAQKMADLLADPGIVRHRQKIAAAVTNAQQFLAVQAECGSFSDYLWDLAGGKPIDRGWRSLDEVPAKTPLSDQLSKDLKRRGFKFMGSTTCYAFLQATGVVNDHLTSCFRHAEVAKLARA